MSLKGKREMNQRLRALRLSFKLISRDWADDYVVLAKPQIPVRTGKTRRSVRRKSATQRRATVVGSFINYFIDAGPKPHDIKAKKAPRLIFQGRHGTVFARQVHHRGYRGRPFRQRTAIAAMKRNPMAKTVIDQYNRAA